ncbi:transcriptional repressor LexA [Gloeocapsa sp. PCC 73106]|uniref:transcriptional repressor LexA n=1 Tax=Gloeocapsa sp. PCC 73106 TaxID=102232 RepID=UPI0002ACB227|nr:transcriptional repressor LexA [Gloeocapsa sp. PCC 73106]ELR98974.1 SOS regulatory protein LexA [Gloeocapsa sp. PCC 73106]
MESLSKVQKELYTYLVDYINETQHAPSIRQMMRAMNLKSPAPIQSRLERLRNKGYIDWNEGKARTIRILHPPIGEGVPILGAIAAGGLVEPFTDVQEILNLNQLYQQPDYYALRVTGDSMIQDLIAEGDYVILREVSNHAGIVKNGAIVAARVKGQGTTLKHFYQESGAIVLKASNPKYEPIIVNPEDVEIQGILVGVWRFLPLTRAAVLF